MGRAATGTVEWRKVNGVEGWHARITVRTADAPKPRRVWLDLERPDLRQTSEDRATAKRLAARRAKLAGKGSFVGAERAAAPKVTLADLEEKWHAELDRDPDLKLKTAARYKQSGVHLLEVFGKVPASELTPLRIREWIWKRRGERSASTVLNDCNALSHFLKVAIRGRWIALTTHPMRDDIVKEAKPKQEHLDAEDIARYSQDELEQLLAADEMPDDVFGLLLVAVTTSARDGELRGLQFKHLKDPRTGAPCVNIVQQAIEIDGIFTVGAPKWGSKRMNPQHSQVAPWLAWWRETGWAALVEREPTDEDFVFPGAAGAMDRPKDEKLLRKWAARAGVPTHYTRSDGERDAFDMNSIRHTFATLLGDLEVDGEVLDALMGHRPKSVRARHYMGMPMERKARAVERLRLTLPDRAGVGGPDESSWITSLAAEPVNDSDPGDTLQPTGTADSIPDRKRASDWCGPRSSKPV